MSYGIRRAERGFDLTGIAPVDARPEVRGWGVIDFYHTAVLVIILLFSFLNLPVYAHIQSDSLLPKYFYFAFLLILAPIYLVRGRALLSYLFSPFALWAIVLLIVNLVHLADASLMGDASRPVAADEAVSRASDVIGTRMQFLVLALIAGYAFFAARTLHYQRVFVFISIVIPLLVALDFLHPGFLYSPDAPSAVPGRPGATLINPTIASEAMLLSFLMACNVLPPRFRGPLFILLACGVFLTFTRSAILACCLLLVFFALKGMLRASNVTFVFIALAGFAIGFDSFYSYLNSRSDIAAGINNIEERLNFFSRFNLEDDSAQSRSSVLQAGVVLFLGNPFAGAGAGATHFWSEGVGTHNQLVMLAAEYGILGVTLWVVLAVMLWRGQYFKERRLQIALCLLFVFMTMFTHNMFDFPYWLLTFSLVSMRGRQ